jgi:hypothetical protein
MDIRKIIDLLEQASYKKGDKIGRWAFIYLEPKTPEMAKDFAQCSSCQLFLPGKQRCAIFSYTDVVKANASCGLYINGKPHDNQKIQSQVTPEQAGYVEAQVRCENCSWYKSGTCDLFATLDKTLPDTFELGSTVSPKGCCNAWG